MSRSYENEDTPRSAPEPLATAGRAETTTPSAETSADNAHDASESSPSASDAAHRHKLGLTKKLQFMTHLMKSFDMLVYAELCTLYYMDCSFFRLLLRSIPHSLFLSPKSEGFLVLMPAHRPHVFAIFVPNIICFLLHMLFALPEAGEATRGYLHGGVIVDFIGQKPPRSKFVLLLLDLVIFVLQCVMLAVHSERERLRKVVTPPRRNNTTSAGENESSSSSAAAAAAAAATTQDHDSEERGVLRDAPTSSETAEGIELQPLNGSAGTGADQGMGRGVAGESPTADLSDVLRSGNAVLADFHVVHAIRTAGNDYQSAAAYSIQTLGYTATLAAMAAERRARLEAGRGQP